MQVLQHDDHWAVGARPGQSGEHRVQGRRLEVHLRCCRGRLAQCQQSEQPADVLMTAFGAPWELQAARLHVGE